MSKLHNSSCPQQVTAPSYNRGKWRAVVLNNKPVILVHHCIFFSVKDSNINAQVIIVTTLALAAAIPQRGYVIPSPYSTPRLAPSASNRVIAAGRNAPPVGILRDYRLQDDRGRYSAEFEAENGIVFAQAGSPEGANGAVVKVGRYSYTAPDGTLVEVKYVADENGFQPQSDLLPVAPEFPHPIPQFVLDQIAFAAQEDAIRAREDAANFRSSQRFNDPYPPISGVRYHLPSRPAHTAGHKFCVYSLSI
ncbi:endocuticle structural glycoprotein SgAbd-1-like [Macrobrachium rosenbergii]|uniref:endocuticle structural glycoprotein SgAbd-1-like n=1 Tax=Macrobrachium rosenbergii TaxID=79674 RepID=UPI0034D7696E